MLTPDQLADRFAPRTGTGGVYARQLVLSDAAMSLAEAFLNVLPRGLYLDYAIEDLELLLQRAFDGTEAAPAAPAPRAQVDQAAQRPGPAPARGYSEVGLDLNLWRTCLRGALHLHPLARLMAYTLAETAGQDGRIADCDQPAIEDLGLGAGLDVGTVLQALEELATHGWISRHNDGGMTRYQLRMPDPATR